MISNPDKYKARIKLTIEFDYPIPYSEGDIDPHNIDDYDRVQFIIEENHCIQNMINHIYDGFEGSACNICTSSEAEFLGFFSDNTA